jgi:site-specific DNA-methyltransferase (adenine-specific)
MTTNNQWPWDYPTAAQRVECIKDAALYLGDCLEVMRGLPDGSVDLVLADIPYGEVSQKSAGLRKLDRGNADTCELHLPTMVSEYVRICKGSFYVFCGTEQISEITSLFRQHGLTTRLGAWEKTNPSPMNGSRLWLSGLEFCVFARKPNATFNEHCKKALWQAPSGRSKVHPTEKPVALMERLIKASSYPGELVMDNTMGSGTTGVAALRAGRRFVGIERDENYFGVACQRIKSVDSPVQLTIENALEIAAQELSTKTTQESETYRLGTKMAQGHLGNHNGDV